MRRILRGQKPMHSPCGHAHMATHITASYGLPTCACYSNPVQGNTCRPLFQGNTCRTPWRTCKAARSTGLSSTVGHTRWRWLVFLGFSRAHCCSHSSTAPCILQCGSSACNLDTKSVFELLAPRVLANASTSVRTASHVQSSPNRTPPGGSKLQALCNSNSVSSFSCAESR